MHLSQLEKLFPCSLAAGQDPCITTVTEDSRRVVPGAVFVAAPGTHVDGHDYAAQAVEKGAVAVIGAREGVSEFCGVPYLHAASPRRALGLLAHALAGDPSAHMTVVGVTGTNGKSSSVLLLQQIARTCGHSAAAFGTIGYDIGGTSIPAPHTTPFGEDLAAMFKKAREAGHTHVAMEVSSHAIEQDRVAGIHFDVAVFTNLTQDHLDYHHDMESYRNAKLRFFEQLEGPGKFTVVNRDDPSANAFIAASNTPCYTYGRDADCGAEDITISVSGMQFQAKTPWGRCEIFTPLVGYHNVSNVLCALTACAGLGMPLDKVAEGIAALSRVPGRFDRVDAGQDFHVIVDYAHTEDGLHNVLRAAREICAGRVIVVFGCGGDRDRTKRPKMAAAVAEMADLGIITSDNPRTEDPLKIIDEVETGMTASGKQRERDYLVIPDRAEAIHRAIGLAKPGDLLLIAGKGHEDYQILGTEKIHFDDREVALTALEGK